jgi:hypothetical protein
MRGQAQHLILIELDSLTTEEQGIVSGEEDPILGDINALDSLVDLPDLDFPHTLKLKDPILVHEDGNAIRAPHHEPLGPGAQDCEGVFSVLPGRDH